MASVDCYVIDDLDIKPVLDVDLCSGELHGNVLVAQIKRFHSPARSHSSYMTSCAARVATIIYNIIITPAKCMFEVKFHV